MALVKCTKTVFEHVKNKIDELFHARLANAAKLHGMTDTEVAKIIYATTHTPERLKAAKTLEEMYVGNQILYSSSKMKFKIKTSEGITRTFDTDLGSTKDMLHSFMYTYANVPEITNAPSDITCAIVEADKRWNAVKKDKEAFKEAFNDAWGKVKSVNELLKAWPAASDLLTSDVMDRIGRKNGPRTIHRESFDATSLNVQLLKAKVAK